MTAIELKIVSSTESVSVEDLATALDRCKVGANRNLDVRAGGCKATLLHEVGSGSRCSLGWGTIIKHSSLDGGKAFEVGRRTFL